MGARVLVVDDSPTLRKVVCSILRSRDYQPLTAEDGQEALETLEREAVDLILLDFVMPRMNGYQFCRELRANGRIQNLPVVLMSAKGDKIRGHFVQQTGAIDAITKPFDARGLIAVVEGAIARHTAGHSRSLPWGEVDENGLPRLGDDPPDISDPMTVITEQDAIFRNAGPRAFAAVLVNLLEPGLAKLPNRDEVEDAITSAVNPDVMAELWALLRTSEDAARSEALSGDISVISISEILQLLQLQRQTGALQVSSNAREITLYVREGNIDLAKSRGLSDEFLFGRYLVEGGGIARAELERVLAAREHGKSSGEQLLQLGLVNEEHIHSALVRQTSELVFECVRWKHGRFTFTAGVSSPESQKARLALATGALVMEGFRRVDEWRLIEGTFDFDEVLYRDEIAVERIGDQSNLTSLERRVLDGVDGKRTVREVVDTIEGSSFELCRIIYQFLNSRLVRRPGA